MTTSFGSSRAGRLLRFILFFGWADSVWFGVGTLVTLFIYSSLGSAYQPIRVYFEMTEFEWFHWWPFKVMIALICVNLTVVTVRRIPFRLMNLGVWLIHAGVLILVAGSVFYFSTKVEGDVPVFRRSVSILVPGRDDPVRLVVRVGNEQTVTVGDSVYRFGVSRILPQWRIAGGPNAGKTAYMTWVSVDGPEDSFTRQLLAGYPQLTEDILADGTRARKTIGKALVDDSIAMRLVYEPQDRFYVMETSALYVRTKGAPSWLERPIKGLPHFKERISSRSDVILDPSDSDIPIRPIDLVVGPVGDGDDPLTGYDVRVTSFLRNARFRTQWREGGDILNPLAKVSLVSPVGATGSYQLLAFDPRRHTAEEGLLDFQWAATPEQVDAIAAAGPDALMIRVPGIEKGVRVELPNGDPIPKDQTQFVPIEGTRYGYRVRSVVHDVPLERTGGHPQSVSFAAVVIRTPEGELSRFVADQPAFTRDIGADGKAKPPDPSIETTFQPGARGMITLVGGVGPGELELILRGSQGVQRQRLVVGKPVTLASGLQIRLDRLMTHALESVKPHVVPMARRRKGSGVLFSMIRVEISRGSWRESKWLEYNRYAFDDPQYAVPGRFSYLPRDFTLPDGRTVQVLYSRERASLPTAIVLEDFELATHTGGFTGETISIRDFISRLRFKTESGWSEPVRMSSNNPASFGGFWYFQSAWDPPGRGQPGMTYTGLGVGNRNGVHIQLLGTIVSVLGMVFAFYIKPVLRRRHAEAVRARAAVSPGADDQGLASVQDVLDSAARAGAGETPETVDSLAGP